MFLKQYNHKPRSNSASSATSAENMSTPSAGGKGASSSNNAQPGAIKGGSGTTSTPANNVGGRRRSSGGDKFAGLTGQKRMSGDIAGDAKKAGFMEQKPGSTNPIQGMWNSFTKGPTGAG